MPISLTCSCSKRLKVRDELAGKVVRCPACGTTLRVAVQGAVARSAMAGAKLDDAPTEARAKRAAFPVLGFCIGWAAVLVGCLLIVAATVITLNINRQGREFKPAGLIVLAFPGLLWVLFGGLLLGLRRRFVTPFWVFLMVNLLVGVLFTTQPRFMSIPRPDVRIFAGIGLGFLLGSIFFQLFHGFLMRDVRRQVAAEKKGKV